MFNGKNGGYSLSDIAAVTGANRSDGAFGGGDNGWWILILFLLAGWGGAGFGGFGGGGYGAAGGRSTLREEISYGFDMNNLENSVRGIQQGLCDGFYAQNATALQGFTGINTAIANSTADIQGTLCQGFNGVNTALLTGFNGIQAQLANDALVSQQ